MKRIIFVLLAAGFLTGCKDGSADVKRDADQQTTAQPAAALAEGEPAIDISTPDRALKTYWAIDDWKKDRKSPFKDLVAAEIKHDQELAKKVQTGDMLAYTLMPGTMPKMSHEIIDVKQNTESRATIIAKIRNVSPIPSGAEVSDSARKARENGDKYKYILEKGKDGWKVSEVYEYVDFLPGDDKWQKRSDPKPSASTYTMP